MKEENNYYFNCEKCRKLLSVKEDNYLGNPEFCKHWCNECFAKIKEWLLLKNKQKRARPKKLKNKLLINYVK